MLQVTRRIDEGDSPAASDSEERLPCRSIGTELGEVAPPEFGPSTGVVPEPAAQGGARCHILGPLIEAEPPFGHPAWPQPLDQHPAPVARPGGLVGTLQSDHAAVPFRGPAPSGTSAFTRYVHGTVRNEMLNRFLPALGSHRAPPCRN